MKEALAKKAFSLIQEGMCVSLGGGQSVALLAELIAQNPKELTLVSPSPSTRALCSRLHVSLQPLEYTKHIDLAFDGCDEVDLQMHALKSKGGIHLQEKIAAQLAEKFIVLADESRLTSVLQWSVPLCLEVLPEAGGLAEKKMEQLGAKLVWRTCGEKAGIVRSDHGNYLADVHFASVPASIEQLAQYLNGIDGILAHSLFDKEVDGALIARKNGQIEYLQKEKTDVHHGLKTDLPKRIYN